MKSTRARVKQLAEIEAYVKKSGPFAHAEGSPPFQRVAMTAHSPISWNAEDVRREMAYASVDTVTLRLGKTRVEGVLCQTVEYEGVLMGVFPL